MNRAFWWACIGAAALVVAFLALPPLALLLRVHPMDVASQLSGPVARDALMLSLKTSLIAQVIVVVVGTPAAYLLARHRFRGRGAVLTLIEMPMVLPPAVAGVGLLAALGREGLLGRGFDAMGVTIPFSEAAVIIAIIFVSSPFFLRQAVGAFESVDPGLVETARTLGASPWRVFRRVSVPLARAGLVVGLTLSLARGLGEFGATIIVAGSIPGITQTMPLAIYAELDRDFDSALAMSAVLLVASLLVLVTARLLAGRSRVLNA